MAPFVDPAPVGSRNTSSLAAQSWRQIALVHRNIADSKPIVFVPISTIGVRTLPFEKNEYSFIVISTLVVIKHIDVKYVFYVFNKSLKNMFFMFFTFLCFCAI